MLYTIMDKKIEYPTFYNSLSNYIHLSDEAYQALEERLIVKKFSEREFVLREGQISRYLMFINEGLMVNYDLPPQSVPLLHIV